LGGGKKGQRGNGHKPFTWCSNKWWKRGSKKAKRTKGRWGGKKIQGVKQGDDRRAKKTGTTPSTRGGEGVGVEPFSGGSHGGNAKAGGVDKRPGAPTRRTKKEGKKGKV